MSKSILQDEKRCFVSGAVTGLDRHHIYAGVGRRKLSERWGCWVWLRHDLHMELHSQGALDKMLKRTCQERFEEIHGHDMFMQVFGKSYL